MNHIKILDCTLRDGAYLVDKYFGNRIIHGIADGLNTAGVDIIELGFLQNEGFGEGNVVFKDTTEAEKFIPQNRNRAKFTLFADYSRYDANHLSKRKEGGIDAIRECFKKQERIAAMKVCSDISEKGYEVFVQPVDILGYSDKELIELIEVANSLEITCFSIVDTFGSMYVEDLRRLYELLDYNLISTISLGFHSHNNMQLSSALSQELVRMAAGKRNIVIDSKLKPKIIDFSNVFSYEGYKPDDIIKFVPYKPASEISDESILNANITPNKNKDSKNLEVSLEVIMIFKKLFKFIRTDLNMEKERKKSKLRNLSLKIFWPGENNFLDQKEKKELYNLFNEKNFVSYFLTILSRQRTKGFKRSEKLMNDLKEIFIKILEKAEEEKNYDVSINCVILSQTFFCETKGKNGEVVKNYILDGIKDNKWLSSFEFWEGVINNTIEREIKKSVKHSMKWLLVHLLHINCLQFEQR